MTAKTSLFIGVAIVAVVGIGWLTNNTTPPPATTTTALETNRTTSNSPTEPAENSDTSVVSETELAPDSPPANSSKSAITSSTQLPAATPRTYTAYSESAVATSDATTKIVFFHATWCPTCKAANAALTSSQASIPADVAIFKADYDTETTLRQQHGVTLQHTFVVLNADGSTKQKWTGSRTLEEILAKL